MEAMELNCKRDINFMYLLEGKPVPDYATFARFRSIHFAPCAKRILAEMSNLLYELGEISGESIFIDGTKAVCIKTGRKHCICTWYRETKNSAAKEYRNIRRLSGPFKRIYKKTAYLWKKEQLF